jgi:hypothetical protein
MFFKTAPAEPQKEDSMRKTLAPQAPVLIAALALILALTLGSATRTLAADKRIVFIDSAGQEIKGIFLAPSGTPVDGPGWGKNLLDKWKLKNGKSVNIAVPHDQGDCKWDLKYLVKNRMAYSVKDVDICQAVEIRLYLKDEQAWATVK